MFGFLKDKLKKTVEKFTKEVDEVTEEVVPTEEQKEEIIKEVKKEKEEKGFFQKLKDTFIGDDENSDEDVEEKEGSKEEAEEIIEKETVEELKEEIKKEKEELSEIQEEEQELEKEAEESLDQGEQKEIHKHLKEDEQKEEELKETIEDQKEEVKDIDEKIAEGEKEIDALNEKQEKNKEEKEEVEEEKKGFFTRLKDKILYKKEETIEEKKEAFEAAGEELQEFEDAFKETEKAALEEEEEEEAKEESKEDLIPVVTKDEEGETTFELREKPTAVGKKAEKVEEGKEELKKPEEPKPKIVEKEPEGEPEADESAKVQQTEPEEESKGIWAALKDTIFKTSLSEEKFEELFWDIEVVLLESNVAVEVIDLIKANLKKELCQKKILRGKVEEIIMKTLQDSVDETFSVPPIDFIKEVKSKKPFVVVFVGINGSGKTTTIGKMIQKLKDNKLSVVVAAGDTFRAAAIQQLEEHTTKLKVKLIKHDYGSDPAAVGFDAIKYAKAHNIDCVLIDTAGRLHSNTNLMDEMKKIIRVAEPDLKLFIGEAITGNDCVEQARRFDDAIGIDGIILAKADVDDKGGAALSVSYVTQKPILYFGVGQEYKDLEAFDKRKMLERLGLT